MKTSPTGANGVVLVHVSPGLGMDGSSSLVVIRASSSCTLARRGYAIGRRTTSNRVEPDRHIILALGPER